MSIRAKAVAIISTAINRLLASTCVSRASLQQALSEARQERAKSEAFVAAIGDLLTIHDAEFRILRQNLTMKQLLGDHVGEHCYRAYHGIESPCTDCVMLEAFRDGELHRGERELRTHEGKTVSLEFTISPVKDARGRVTAVIELVRDITERKQAELRLSIQLAVSDILAMATPTVAEAIPLVLEAICKQIGWDLGGVWWVNRRENRLQMINSWHVPELQGSGFIEASRAITFAPGIGLPGRVWSSGTAAWIDDVLQDDNYPRKPHAQASGLHGAFAFPITLRGATVGVMEFHSRRVRRLEPSFLRVMVPLGSQLGQLIERKHAEEALRESERRFRESLENIRLLAIELDVEGAILFCNDYLLHLTGWTREDLVGHNWFDILVPDGPDLRNRYRTWMTDGTMPTHHENDIITRTGERRLISWNITTLNSPGGKPCGTACIGEDITSRRAAEEQLRHISTHDTLTGLYNRAFFDEELERLMRSRQFPVSIIMADIDGLKRINDTLGHSAGDRLIHAAATILFTVFRSEDVVARIGGDEFAVLLPETDATAADASVMRIRECQDRFNAGDSGFQVSISVGAATAPGAQALSQALRLSDQRMYLDKFFRKRLAGPDMAAAAADPIRMAAGSHNAC